MIFWGIVHNYVEPLLVFVKWTVGDVLVKTKQRHQIW
jgi:hypothetical protein